MANVATGMANETKPCFVSSTGASVLTGNLLQQNSGVITSIILTPPIVLGAPFTPGGAAASMNLALIPVGPAPHASVGLRMNFYDTNGNVVGIQDIS